MAGNPGSGGLGCPAGLGWAWLGLVSAVQPAHLLGALRRIPAGMTLIATPLQCCCWGVALWGGRRKEVASGDSCGSFGTSQAGHVFEEHSLRQGPNLRRGSLWHVWRCLHPLSGLGERRAGLSCSGLGQESKEGTCCVGLRTSHVFMVVPSEQGSGSSVPPGAFCGIPACKPSVSGLCCSCCPSVIWAGLGWGLRLVVS